MDNNQVQNNTGKKNLIDKTKITNSIGGFLIIIGILILLEVFFDFGVGRFIWPFFFIVPGSILLYIGFNEQISNGEPFVITGSIIGMLGLLFLYQTITNHWASWAYAWALIAPTSFGLGLWRYGNHRDKPHLVQSGKELAKIGGIIFLIGAAFFEVLIGISKFGRMATPALLILAGIFLLYLAVKK